MCIRALATAGFVCLWLVGCGSPCDDLDNKICDCEANQTNKDACLTRVGNDKRTVDSTEQQRCSQLNKTCTCSALACGNLAACGLAKDTQIDAGTQTCQ
jgi:hypothetical protein